MRITCPSCQAVLDVPDASAGKRGKCGKCGATVEIPAAQEPAGVPATDRQKDYAESLGIGFPPDITKAEMSKLIGKAVREQEGKRYDRLEELEKRESEVREQLRGAVLAEMDEEDPRLSQATPTQMLEELEGRSTGAILITFDMTKVDMTDLAGAVFSVESSPSVEERDIHRVLAVLGSKALNQGW